ncbi:hypothetical protein [Tamlana crocina]|uniref:Uncharacterized protein n=1 Tax=Tamlana crocina TaxID=393006 RepID=A0ABX1DHN5_9FLAO|nr:hypothetical protein [Tamlana crocina]NJX15826.1 hypothetical protein [Tamlana crocina]
MKISAMFYVGLISFLLVLLAVMVSMDVPFALVFYTKCVGQFFLLVMVYKVLKDNYKTDKTFDHFYEDYPIDFTEE